MPFIYLAKPADGVHSATVTRWSKGAGDRFAAGEWLLELETEDAILRVEAPEAGTLAEILAHPGSTVASGMKLARIESTVSLQAAAAIIPSLEKSMPSEDTSGAPNKVIPILMPQASNTMEEGTMLSWRVRQGDQIKAGQVICEIETDKATVDFESPDGGRLARIVATPGQSIAVKELIALLADNDADADAYLRQKQTGVPQRSRGP